MAEIFRPDNLVAGAAYVVTEEVVIDTGLTLQRGSLIGKVTLTGHGRLCDLSSSDGSQVPYGILLEPVNASDGPAMGTVGLTGEYFTDEITLGSGWTPESVKTALRTLNIHLKE